MKAAVLTQYGKIELKEVENPKVGNDDVLIKVSYAGICGSDEHVFKGEFHPRTHVPYIPGHEFAGVVEGFGKDVTGFTVGEKVAADPIIWCGKCPACEIGHYPACKSLKLIGIDIDGGFSEYIAVPKKMIYKLPANIPDEHCALIEVLAIGFHASKRANIKQGDTAAIFGAGKVGQCILQAVKTKTDNTVFLIDILDERLNIPGNVYKNLIIINAKKENPAEVIAKHTDGKGVNIAFEAIGHYKEVPGMPNPVQSCIKSIVPAGTVCVLGLSDHPTPILLKEIIFKEAKILTSRVSHGEFAETIENLSKGTLNPDLLISDIISPDKAQEAYKMLETEPEKHLKILLDFKSLSRE